MTFAISGVYCAATTPLNADLSPDLGLFGTHCSWLLANGCHGIALLGTTGEANSFSVAERQSILEGALAAGIAPDQLMPGTGVAAFTETVALTRHALANGVRRVVMLPPFYYKNLSDEGVYSAYARIIDGVGDDRLQVVLYHIPQMSAVPISQAVVARLIEAYPRVVVGLKDSSGDLVNMQQIAAAHPGFSVLAGPDALLLPMMRSGGAGCITAACNLVPDALRTIYEHYADPARESDVQAAHVKVDAYRKLATSYVQIPAVKAMLSFRFRNDSWRRVRPPLVAMNGEELTELESKYKQLP